MNLLMTWLSLTMVHQLVLLMPCALAVHIPCGVWRSREVAGRENYWCERDALYMHGKHANNGTAEALIQNYENVFQDDLVEMLLNEAKPYEDIAKTVGPLKHRKSVTFFIPWYSEPRTMTEVAAIALRNLVFPNGMPPGKNIEGMKYWYQWRTASENVNFHYDKDEGMASDQQIMRFPYINTLVYLTNEGAPTIFFNRTVIHNGNVPVPLIPGNGWVVYPKRNKWTLQRGDLLHGAIGRMALENPSPNKPRITLVVSFEDLTPVEPNCHYLSREELPLDGMKQYEANKHRIGKLLKPHAHFKEVKPTELSSKDWQGQELVTTDLRLADTPLAAMAQYLRVQLPASIQSRETYNVQWHGRSLLGLTKELDMDNGELMEDVFEDEHAFASVTSFLFVKRGKGSISSSSAKELECFDAVCKRLIQRDEEEHLLDRKRNINCLHAFSDKAADVMANFGISAADLPAAAVYYSSTGKMYRMTRRGPLTEETLYKFYSDVLASRLQPLAEENEL